MGTTDTTVQPLIGLIGANIKYLRKRKAMTQKDLAARSGLSPNYASMIESGKKPPSLKTLSKICGVLGVSLSDLMEDNLLRVSLDQLIGQFGLEAVENKLQLIKKSKIAVSSGM